MCFLLLLCITTSTWISEIFWDQKKEKFLKREIKTYCVVNGEGGCSAAADAALPLMKELVQMISAHYLC